MNLASATSGTATVGITLDTSVAKSAIESFVTTYNDVTSQIDALVSSADSGSLKGNSIVRQINRDLQSIVLNTSSTPGNTITRLGDMGITITKTGELEIDHTDLDAVLANNYEDVKTVFSANTNNDSEIGDATRGIAGDLSKLIKDLTSSTGYLTTNRRRSPKEFQNINKI